MASALTHNVIWHMMARDLRQRMASWTDQQLADYAASFQHPDHAITGAYLREVAEEQQRRSQQKSNHHSRDSAS